jgi:hypothetical protein
MWQLKNLRRRCWLRRGTEQARGGKSISGIARWNNTIAELDAARALESESNMRWSFA